MLSINSLYDEKKITLFRNAVISDNLEELKMLTVKYRQHLDDTIFNVAATYGNLDIMKWLLENNCPWNEYTFRFAVKHGNLENIKWLYDNGCPFDSWAFNCALQSGNKTIIQWLKEHNCPIDLIGQYYLIKNPSTS